MSIQFVFCLLCILNCCCVFVDFVTDFDFSPFDDYLLSTCSQDGTVSFLTCLTKDISDFAKAALNDPHTVKPQVELRDRQTD